MNLISKLLIFLLMISCGRTGSKKVSTPDMIERRANLYMDQIHLVQDDAGFIETGKCDSLLFTSLLGAAGVQVDLRAAEESPGKWLRRPLSYDECWSNGKSRSEISRDMILGVMFYAWFKKDLQMLEDIWDYGRSQSWVMGAGDLITSTLSPNYVILLARMIRELGGEEHSSAVVPTVVSDKCEGFTCHLLVLYLLLLGEVDGGLSKSRIAILDKVSERNPKNAFYVAAARIYGVSRPWNIDWRLYPALRLPNTSDRCSPWVIERDDNDSSFTPCNKFRMHSGGELILVNWMLKGMKWKS